MSNAAMHWAWNQSAGGPAQKAILTVLADLADEMHSCFPSVEYISRVSEVSERSARRHLAQLEAAHLLRRERRYAGFGVRQTDRYFLNVNGDFPKPNTSGANLAGNDQRLKNPLAANLAGNAKTPDQVLAAKLAANEENEAPLAANCGRYIETHQPVWSVGSLSPENENPTNQTDRVAGAPAREATQPPVAIDSSAIDAELEKLLPGVGLTFAAIAHEVDGRADLALVDVVRAVRETVLRSKNRVQNPAAMVGAVIVRKPTAWLIGAAPGPAAWDPDAPVPSAVSRCNNGVHNWGDLRLPELARSHCVTCNKPRRSVDALFAELEDEHDFGGGH